MGIIGLIAGETWHGSYRVMHSAAVRGDGSTGQKAMGSVVQRHFLSADCLAVVTTEDRESTEE